MRAARSRVGLLWPGLGLLGSSLTTVAATRLLDGRPIRWWWRFPLPASHSLELNLFFAGVVLLCAAWVGLGSRLRQTDAPRPRELVFVAALWAVPLALGPALFSRDVFSYLAQGSILNHGLNPYRVAPAVLIRWHEGDLLSAVSVNWRHTTAPYGPIFLALAGLAETLAGGHLALGVELARGLALVGLALLAVFVPRLARRLGADPALATWLALASPLSLLYFVGSGHNDALMAGLTVAGVTLALEERPLAGIALCLVAAAIKLPAAAGAAAIAICWLRAHPARWRSILARSAALAAALVLGIGLLTGVGLSWISGSLFSTPASARLAITPATAIAVAIHELGHGVHAGVEQAAAPLEQAAARIAMGLAVALAAWLCVSVRRDRLVRYLGLMLTGAAIGGPEAWPWYLIWGVSLLAADPLAQRSPWLAIAVLVPAFLVMPGGDVAVALPHAYELVIVYAAVVAVAVASARRRPARLARARSPLPTATGSLEAT